MINAILVLKREKRIYNYKHLFRRFIDFEDIVLFAIRLMNSDDWKEY